MSPTDTSKAWGYIALFQGLELPTLIQVFFGGGGCVCLLPLLSGAAVAPNSALLLEGQGASWAPL